MDTKEADRLWNLPKCERCDAMEARLRACLTANQTLHDGLKKAENSLRELYALVKAASKKWGQA